MNIEYNDVIGAFFIYHFFDEQQCEKIRSELQWLVDPAIALSSSDAGGKDGIRTSTGIPIESVIDTSDIITCMDQLYDMTSILAEIDTTYSDLKDIDRQSHLINHYRDGQYYDYHIDRCNYTMINISSPYDKKWSGGNLVFAKDDHEVTRELTSNDIVLFKGSTLHKVTPVVFEQPEKSMLDGRISISKFIHVRSQ